MRKSKLVRESVDELSFRKFKLQDEQLRNKLERHQPRHWKKAGNREVLNLKKIFKELKEEGYYMHDTFQEFQNYLIDNMDDYSLDGLIQIPRQKRKELDKKWARDIIENYSEMIISPEEAEDEDLVLRSYMGEGPVIIFKTGELDQGEVNSLKSAYSINTGLNYYDARPIRFKNWKKLPEIRKWQTYYKGEKPDETSDDERDY